MAKDKSNERGQGLLEATLVTLSFFIILVGIIDVGQVLFVHQSIVERVRGAIRYGVVHDYDATAIRNKVLYDQATLPDGSDPDDPPAGFLGLTAANVAVSREDATFNEDRLIVTVSDYSFSFFTPFIAGHYRGKPITASMPFEGL